MTTPTLSGQAAGAAALLRGGPLGLLARKRDQLLVLVVLLAIWQGLSILLGEYWIGTPWGTVLRLVAGIADGELLRHASYTVAEAIIGFLIGGIPAAALPFLLRRLPMATAIIDPIMVGGYGSPKLALAPLFILWFGIGIESKIALIVFTVFFIVYFSTLAGIRALDPRLVQMAQMSGASESDIARHIIFPGAVPHIFAGLRIAMPYSIGAAVVAELISANRGLGYMIQLRSMNFDTTGIFVALAAVCFIVAAANGFVNIVERHLLLWRPPADVTAQKE